MNKKNVLLVLSRLTNLVALDQVDALSIGDGLETMLGELNQNDTFGTEGQIDPRGDFRDGEWSMNKVQK